MRVGVFGAEHGPNFEHFAKVGAGGTHLFVQLRRLRQTGVAAKVLEFEHFAAAFAGAGDQFRGLDFHESAAERPQRNQQRLKTLYTKQQQQQQQQQHTHATKNSRNSVHTPDEMRKMAWFAGVRRSIHRLSRRLSCNTLEKN